MRKIFALAGLAVGCLLGIQLTPVWAVPPTVKEMLAYQPKQRGVAIATPTAEEESKCKVKPFENNKGYLLVDAGDIPLRKFFDARGGKRVDTWCYYKDGIEVYREMDTQGTNVANQFRWLNTAGMKLGVSTKGNGVIDRWLMISAEEVAEEIFQAVVENNPKRIEPLFINGDELKSLNLSADMADKVFKAVQAAPAKFAKVMQDIPAKAQFVRVETATPCLVPSEDLGSDHDAIHFISRAVLYQNPEAKAENKHDYLHTGSMIQVGSCWRLIDGPAKDMPVSYLIRGFRGGEPPPPNDDPLLQQLKKEVADLDGKYVNTPQGIINTPDAVVYNSKRVGFVQQIIVHPKLRGEERETWIKQLCDNLANSYIASNGKNPPNQALVTLGQYKDQLIQSKSNLVPYAFYRHVWATYAPQLQDPKSIPTIQKIQEKYNEELARFVQTYPQAEDTPDALWQLGMGSEFGGRDEEAKRWYKTLADNYPTHHLAAKSKGAVERLSLLGQELKLHGKRLGTDNNFDVAQLRGKVVVVYYWASYCNTCPGDFAAMKKLQAANASKGLELVLVNLDDSPEAALQFLRTNPINGVHLYEAPPAGASGMQSPLSLQYGLIGLPTMFLVGRDGKVMSRTLQASDLETNVKGSL